MFELAIGGCGGKTTCNTTASTPCEETDTNAEYGASGTGSNARNVPINEHSFSVNAAAGATFADGRRPVVLIASHSVAARFVMAVCQNVIDINFLVSAQNDPGSDLGSYNLVYLQIQCYGYSTRLLSIASD